MKKRYYDKHGKEILAGMLIRHDSGETEEVYAIGDGNGNEDLGICATNPAYAAQHPYRDLEYYSLSNFYLNEWRNEWEIIKEG